MVKRTVAGGAVVWAAPTVLASSAVAQGTPPAGPPGSTWVAVGERLSANGARAWTSPNNGDTWSSATTEPNAETNAVATDGAGKWVAVGSGGAGAWTSPNPEDRWTQATAPLGWAASGVATNGAGVWVAVGNSGAQARSEERRGGKESRSRCSPNRSN